MAPTFVPTTLANNIQLSTGLWVFVGIIIYLVIVATLLVFRSMLKKRGYFAEGSSLKVFGKEINICTCSPIKCLQCCNCEKSKSNCNVCDTICGSRKRFDLGDIFTSIFRGSISEIHKKTSSVQTKVSWKTVIKKFTMMPNPHCESGSQGYFTMTAKDFSRNLAGVSALRFTLHQPSPNWKTFSLEELYVYSAATVTDDIEQVPKWLLKYRGDEEDANEANFVEQARAAGLPDPDEVSRHLHEMLRLTEKVEEFKPTTDLGRFDVDGCYEINLLSYT